MRDMISCVKHFAESLVTNPAYTAKATAHGFVHGAELPSPHNVTTPVLGACGLALLFLGATSGNPVSIGLGAFESIYVPARYFEHGEDLLRKPPEDKDVVAPPAPEAAP